MANGSKLVSALWLLALFTLPLWAQVQAPVQPVPIPGGDLLAPFGLFNQFLPGVGSMYDGLNAEPHGITNFRGSVAMGYTTGTATDQAGRTYNVITDVRVYQGDYVGAVANEPAGGTKSARGHCTFVEIWIDLYDPRVGSGFVRQLHDFNPGITPNGVFWIVSVPDDAVEIKGDSLTLTLKDVSTVDQLQFPGGTGTAPVKVTLKAIYTKIGSPRRVRPTSHDPLSPFNWAGEMWMAINSGTFSVKYTDGSFSASGDFSSSGSFGEMGTERNGSFVEREDIDDQTQKDQTSGAAIAGPQTIRSETVAMALKSSRARPMRDWKPNR
jgi:hypothetical protein